MSRERDATFLRKEGPNAIFEIEIEKEQGKENWMVEAIPFYEIEPEKEGNPKKREQLRERFSRLRDGMEVTVVFSVLRKSKTEPRAGAVLQTISGTRYRVKFSVLQEKHAEFIYQGHVVCVDFKDHPWLPALLKNEDLEAWMIGDFVALDESTKKGTLIDIQKA